MIQIDNCIKYFKTLIFDELVTKVTTYENNLTNVKSIPIRCWIAGGALKSYFLSESSTDVDLFFPNREEFEKAYKHFQRKGCEVTFENENVIKYRYKGKVFDLVKKHFNNPQETIDQFDFTVTCASVDSVKFYHHPSFFIDLAKKQLMVNNLPYPLSTMWRMQKYMLKGYRMCKGEMLKLVDSIQRLKSQEEVEDQQMESSLEGFQSDSSAFNGID